MNRKLWVAFGEIRKCIEMKQMKGLKCWVLQNFLTKFLSLNSLNIWVDLRWTHSSCSNFKRFETPFWALFEKIFDSKTSRNSRFLRTENFPRIFACLDRSCSAHPSEESPASDHWQAIAGITGEESGRMNYFISSTLIKIFFIKMRFLFFIKTCCFL